MKALKIIGYTLYGLLSVVIVALLIWSAVGLATAEDGWAALGVVVLMIVSLYVSIGYIIPIITSIIGLCRIRKIKRKNQLITNQFLDDLVVCEPVPSKKPFVKTIVFSIITPAIACALFLVVLAIFN